MFKGRYTCEQVVAVVGYLVSFIPDLSLSSRKPYIALMGRGDTHRGQWMKFRQKCKKKNKKMNLLYKSTLYIVLKLQSFGFHGRRIRVLQPIVEAAVPCGGRLTCLVSTAG